MKDKSLLVCISFHYSEGSDRWKYVSRLIDNFLDSYNFKCHVIIDTNGGWKGSPAREGFEIVTHENLSHPFHLTWMHRYHILENIDNYDYFMYIEDDMLLPFENFVQYIENFKMLWPNYVPSFVRIEESDGKKFITDMVHHQNLNGKIQINGKGFISLSRPYHAFWIMPQKELKETLTKDFARLSDSRETAASYPMWELNKTPLVMVENGQVSPLCYSYHLPNNYATCKEIEYAKIEINKLLIQ